MNAKSPTPAEIKAIRLRHGWNIAQLGALLGVCAAAVGHWESELAPVPEPAARLLRRLVAERAAGLGAPDETVPMA